MIEVSLQDVLSVSLPKQVYQKKWLLAHYKIAREISGTKVSLNINVAFVVPDKIRELNKKYRKLEIQNQGQRNFLTVLRRLQCN